MRRLNENRDDYEARTERRRPPHAARWRPLAYALAIVATLELALIAYGFWVLYA